MPVSIASLLSAASHSSSFNKPPQVALQALAKKPKVIEIIMRRAELPCDVRHKNGNTDKAVAKEDNEVVVAVESEKRLLSPK